MNVTSERLALVMPTYNEEEVVEKTVNEWLVELRRLKINFKLHVYNDGSKDSTLAKLQNLEHENQDLVVHDKENSGHGPTILFGYRENSNNEWLLQIDSDGEMNPDYFHVLWEKRNNFDFLLGKRVSRNRPLSRSLISFASRVVTRILYGTGVYDVNSPYRLMRTDLFKDYFSSIPSDTVAPNIILSGIACLKKFRIHETPVPYNFRQTGEVSIKKFKLFKLAVQSFFQTIRFRFYL